jgi:hypothetical protein
MVITSGCSQSPINPALADPGVRFIMKTEMNREEKITEAYLESLGFKDVVFEPEGKSRIPDFQIDGNIAVEVRRLNQHYFTKDKVRGLEERRIPLFQLF